MTKLASNPLRAAARFFGYDISKIHREALAPKSFYDLSPSCQVPMLAVLYETIFGRKTDGVFVEVGAFDGFSFSNTSGLAQAGWKGFYIEPVPAFAEMCRSRYAENKQIVVVNAAMGAADGELEIRVGGSLTTANQNLAAHYQGLDWAKNEFAKPATLRVKKSPLNRFLREHRVPAGFDLLVVDVEGYETEVFAGFDLRAWRPKMLIVELCDLHPDMKVLHQSDALLLKQIVGEHYVIVYKDCVNTIFVAEELYDATVQAG